MRTQVGMTQAFARMSVAMQSEYNKYFAEAIAQGKREDALVHELQENELNDIYDGVRRCERIEF
jgi:hypothetical protein